jgi:hypothetical protein
VISWFPTKGRATPFRGFAIAADIVENARSMLMNLGHRALLEG